MDTGRLNECIGKEGNYEFMASIIIPVYNAQDYIDLTLNSILDQDFDDYEILLVDDCSTDFSKEKIEPFLAENIKYFREPKNSGGPSIPRNTGIRHSSGKYIFLFDSDDVMLPGKLRESVLALESCPEIGLLHTNFQSISEQGGVLAEDFLTEYTSFRLEFSREGKDWFRLKSGSAYKALLKANFVGTSSVAVPRWVFNKLGYFDDQLTNGDDFDLWLRISRSYDFLFIDKVLHQYRIQPNSISFRGGQNILNKIRVLERQQERPQDADDIERIDNLLAVYYCQAGMADVASRNRKVARKHLLKSFRLKASIVPVKYYLASYLNDYFYLMLKRVANRLSGS